MLRERELFSSASQHQQQKIPISLASASYRSGEDLYSERDEELKRFKLREVAPVSFLLKLDHAPDWTLDRKKLWNEAEKVEKAWNAQLAHEVLATLLRGVAARTGPVVRPGRIRG